MILNNTAIAGAFGVADQPGACVRTRRTDRAHCVHGIFVPTIGDSQVVSSMLEDQILDDETAEYEMEEDLRKIRLSKKKYIKGLRT